MGAYSEIDIDRRCGDSPFGEGGAPVQNTPAFVEEPLTAPPAPRPAATAAANQAESDAILTSPAQETSTALTETPNDTGKPAKAAESTAAKEEKKRAHAAAEAKRKAEFEARQAAKKAAEQEQLDRLAAMSDSEVLEASMKRVSADTEKLTRRNMKEAVAEYIQTKCIEDLNFAKKVMHPRKSMIRCFQYISRKAWEYVQDELKANGVRPNPGQQGYGCDVPDDLCYQWAEDYFNNPDVKEDHEEEEKFMPKPYTSGVSKGRRGKKAKGKAGDKKADAAKEATKETQKKSAPPTGQLSFSDFVMPEEKAG